MSNRIHEKRASPLFKEKVEAYYVMTLWLLSDEEIKAMALETDDDVEMFEAVWHQEITWGDKFTELHDFSNEAHLTSEEREDKIKEAKLIYERCGEILLLLQ
jgi:hypothetical protein